MLQVYDIFTPQPAITGHRAISNHALRGQAILEAITSSSPLFFTILVILLIFTSSYE